MYSTFIRTQFAGVCHLAFFSLLNVAMYVHSVSRSTPQAWKFCISSTKRNLHYLSGSAAHHNPRGNHSHSCPSWAHRNPHWHKGHRYRDGEHCPGWFLMWNPASCLSPGHSEQSMLKRQEGGKKTTKSLLFRHFASLLHTLTLQRPLFSNKSRERKGCSKRSFLTSVYFHRDVPSEWPASRSHCLPSKERRR